MKKLVSLLLFCFVSIICYAEQFNTIAGFTLGTSLDDFKQSEVFEFVKSVSNSYWNKRNCVCYSFEPYVLQADKYGKEKGFEEVNNRKRSYIENNPITYAKRNVYSLDLIFYNDKLFYITAYFTGNKTSADKKGKLTTSYMERSFYTADWKPLKEALSEKYELNDVDIIDTVIPVYSNWTLPSGARDFFLVYNPDYVLAKCSKQRALGEAVTRANKNSSYIFEDLVMHYYKLLSKDNSRNVEMYSWSFDGECNQPFIILSDQNVINEIENSKNKNNYDSLKDQI